jgi:acyl-CoA dehydrogenase
MRIPMPSSQTESIRQAVAHLCNGFGEDYWLELEKNHAYPTEFVKALSEAGFLAALIPEQYGGSGLGLIEACAILEEISKSGGHPGACHAQMYVMGSVLRHGSEAQKQTYLPPIARGELRLQSFGITEPTTGTDTTSLKTTATRDGDTYRINGQKVWISRVEHSDLMLLLARTTPKENCARKTEGMSAFIIDLNQAIGHGLTVQPIEAMINHHACELFFDNLEVSVENLLGPLDQGFRVVLDAMNAERILIAAECIGDARYFIKKASDYANERVVFDRPIGANQGVQFPIAQVYAEMRAADLMVKHAASLFDAQTPCGSEANMAKMLAADASWKAGDIAMQTFGGFAFAKEYHIERKFRETRLYRTAPISTNLILSHLATKDLGLPRSF